MLDGSLETRVSASGYLQGGYWNLSQDPYGTRIHRRSSSLPFLSSHFNLASLFAFDSMQWAQYTIMSSTLK